MDVPIIWEDSYYIAVNKPAGLPVHKNKFLQHDADYLTKLTGSQLGISVYNTHRLDAKTSGVIILAKSSESASKFTKLFERREIGKSYRAIVKGNPGQGTFIRQVMNRKKGKRVDATTLYSTDQTIITNINYKDIKNVNLSLIHLKPETGRWHQLRQHCSQERYDIIGDIQHGDWTLNRIISDITGIGRLMLHAEGIDFIHPYDNSHQHLSAELPEEFYNIINADLSFSS